MQLLRLVCHKHQGGTIKPEDIAVTQQCALLQRDLGVQFPETFLHTFSHDHRIATQSGRDPDSDGPLAVDGHHLGRRVLIATTNRSHVPEINQILKLIHKMIFDYYSLRMMLN